MTFVAMKGATAWEAQIGRVWFHLRFLRFWRSCGPGFVRIVPREAGE